MNILLLGNGGREHALAWKLTQSPQCTKLFCAPGNAGIAQLAEIIDLEVENIEEIVKFAQRQHVDLVVPGPEVAFVAGIVDAFEKVGIACFGPSQKAAQLEGSKGFMKDLCKKKNVPSAGYQRFTDLSKAREFIEQHDTPVVIKADGLAAGKGVILANTAEEAMNAAEMMMEEYAFGAAGQEIVIEEYLHGEELSFFAISDGQTVLPMTSAQDHKRAGDGDTGANTGGMGAYSPVPWVTQALESRIMQEIIQPIIDGMAEEGIPFKGILFAGLMVENGIPKVLEFNVRFGDPECQVLMLRLQDDLVELLRAAANGTLCEYSETSWGNRSALSVVMAAEGYPEPYQKHTVIKNLDRAEETEDVVIFHAGTAIENDKLVNIGGRVLNITALAGEIGTAREKAYRAIDQIDWPQGYYRRDIGKRALD